MQLADIFVVFKHFVYSHLSVLYVCQSLCVSLYLFLIVFSLHACLYVFVYLHVSVMSLLSRFVSVSFFVSVSLCPFIPPPLSLSLSLSLSPSFSLNLFENEAIFNYFFSKSFSTKSYKFTIVLKLYLDL